MVWKGEAKGMETGKQGEEVRFKMGHGGQTNDSFIKQPFSAPDRQRKIIQSISQG